MLTGILNLGGGTISCVASHLIFMYVIVSGLELKKPLVSSCSFHVASQTKEAADYEPSTWELTLSRMILIGFDDAKLHVWSSFFLPAHLRQRTPSSNSTEAIAFSKSWSLQPQHKSQDERAVGKVPGAPFWWSE